MRKRLAVFAFAASASSLFGVAFAGASHATTLPPACVRQPTPLGQLQIGYCPS